MAVYGVALFLLYASIISGCTTTHSSTIVEDDFEGPGPSPYWRAEAPFDYSIRQIRNPVGDGHALQFEWRKEDWDGTRRTKGTELKSPLFQHMPPQTLSMRIYFDEGLTPAGKTPIILMQYHSVPDLKDGEQWRHPITALVYQNGDLSYSYRNSRQAITPGQNGRWQYDHEGLIKLGKPLSGQWNNLEIRQTFDVQGSNGRIDIRFNGNTFSAKNISLGYNDKKGPYLKFGVYCPQSSKHSKILVIFDNIHLKTH